MLYEKLMNQLSATHTLDGLNRRGRRILFYLWRRRARAYFGRNNMKMNHRHFVFIAGALRKCRAACDAESWNFIVAKFALDCANTNENFNKELFLEACHKEEQP